VTEKINFKVSSALKNIIGKDLINDKYIAVFELVKNSYDAGASEVRIIFDNIKNSNRTKIIISDNGSGMNYNDIVEKWLFVAYSEKKAVNREKTGYRDKIRRAAAGAKGVGRFSCDRLGAKLTLTTKVKEEQKKHRIFIDWEEFEKNDSEEFIDIDVGYECEVLSGDISHGTELTIESIREPWDRESMLLLKGSLKKLINPETDDNSDPFKIQIIAEEEIEQDSRETNMKKVNGEVKNDIFEKLNLKTTSITVDISKNGGEIETLLNDRGTQIFTMVEKNTEYPELSDVRISIHFLNRSAKTNFTRIMGVEPINYGSVFVYKNGFRVYPFGAPGDDFFKIDVRKTQGTKRYFGTREIMGRISIFGDNPDFIETTSRDGGFIKTPAVEKLIDFFVKKVLATLEKYVVNVIDWGAPIEGCEIDPRDVPNKIISEFTSLSRKSDILSLEYNAELFEKSKIDPQSLFGSIEKLESVARSKDNDIVADLAKKVRERVYEVMERNISLRVENEEKTETINRAEEEKRVREQQIYFLKGISNQNVKNLIDGMHSISTLSDAVVLNVQSLKKIISEPSKEKDKQKLLLQVETINVRINKLVKLAIKGNQSLKQIGSNSVKDFLKGCVEIGLARKELDYVFLPDDNNPFNCRFDTSSVSIIFDNLLSNSVKAGATIMNIQFTEDNNNVFIHFCDNGRGLKNGMSPEEVFNYGVTTTEDQGGFGVGLHHAKILAEDMKGKIFVNENFCSGFEVVLGLKK